MGGNALADALLRTLRSAFPGRRIDAIASYADKADFGDLDLLIEADASYDPAALARALQATEMVGNGDVTSIGVPLDAGVFQVDLIRTTPACFDFASHYYGHNDMGNLLGRVAHEFGAKFGHLGLLLPVRDPANSSRLLDEICITDDFATALGLLGYDAARYAALRAARQFRTLADIFRYVISTPYASKAIYLLDNRSRKARTRDAKRATYTAFLAWLDAQPEAALPAYPWGASGTPERAAQQYAFLQRAFACLPEFQRRYAQVHARAARSVQLKEKFNGALVARMTGLSGKALGDVMTRVRASFADEEAFEAFVLDAGADAIAARVLSA